MFISVLLHVYLSVTTCLSQCYYMFISVLLHVYLSVTSVLMYMYKFISVLLHSIMGLSQCYYTVLVLWVYLSTIDISLYTDLSVTTCMCINNILSTSLLRTLHGF